MESARLKKPVFSAIVFFATLGVLSVGYGAFISNYPSTASVGETVSSTEWNEMVSALQVLDSKVS